MATRYNYNTANAAYANGIAAFTPGVLQIAWHPEQTTLCLSGAFQRNDVDFGRNADAKRRPPITRAAAHKNGFVVHAVKTA